MSEKDNLKKESVQVRCEGHKVSELCVCVCLCGVVN